MGAAQQAVKS
jgi:hypothetical protein